MPKFIPCLRDERRTASFLPLSASLGWRRRLAASAAIVLALPGLSWSATPDPAALGRELTPLGGDRSASSDGQIPAWSGDLGGPASFQSGKELRIDSWRYKSDRPLFSVDASNVEQHKEKLSPGQVALIKQTPGFRMDVYPTRRGCSAPNFVVENTRRNVGFAKIADDGWRLVDAYLPGVPFPQPKTGIEAMWNQRLRYRGVGAVAGGYTYLSPRKGQTEWIAPEIDQSTFIAWGAPGTRKVSDMGNINGYVHYVFKKPVALAGQAGMVTDYLNQSGNDAYYYFPGQRRVRRMPAYAYDAPQIGFENQYAMDEGQVISGALDRFDWKLVGKKELLVPYNSFGAFDFKADPAKLLQPGALASTHRRYELHRVWVVEATVKKGLRHLSPKRTYYIDEDSWNPLLAEDYDAQDRLTKVREGYLVPIFEVGSCDVAAFTQYNLLEGRYLVDFSSIGAKADFTYVVQPNHPALKANFYTPDNLRAMSER